METRGVFTRELTPILQEVTPEITNTRVESRVFSGGEDCNKVTMPI